PIPVLCSIILTLDFHSLEAEVAFIVENSLLVPKITNVLPKIGRYRVDDASQSSIDSLHTVPNSPAFSALPFAPNTPPSAMDASECLDALESDVTRIHAQIDSLKSTIENFVRTLQTSSTTNIPLRLQACPTTTVRHLI
ncbi:hypothetical protein L208DRAFT_1316282, partial [Tricholoma matsutake]